MRLTTIGLKFEIVTVMTFEMTDDSNEISKGFPQTNCNRIAALFGSCVIALSTTQQCGIENRLQCLLSKACSLLSSQYTGVTTGL